MIVGRWLWLACGVASGSACVRVFIDEKDTALCIMALGCAIDSYKVMCITTNMIDNGRKLG